MTTSNATLAASATRRATASTAQATITKSRAREMLRSSALPRAGDDVTDKVPDSLRRVALHYLDQLRTVFRRRLEQIGLDDAFPLQFPDLDQVRLRGWQILHAQFYQPGVLGLLLVAVVGRHFLLDLDHGIGQEFFEIRREFVVCRLLLEKKKQKAY